MERKEKVAMFEVETTGSSLTNQVNKEIDALRASISGFKLLSTSISPIPELTLRPWGEYELKIKRYIVTVLYRYAYNKYA